MSRHSISKFTKIKNEIQKCRNTEMQKSIFLNQWNEYWTLKLELNIQFQSCAFQNHNEERAMAWMMRLDVTASSRWMYICGVTRGGHPRTREAYGLPFCYTAQSQCLVGRVCTSHPASLPYQRSLSSRSWLRLVWRIRRGFTATQRWFRGGCSACVSPRVHVVHVWVRVCMYVRAYASKLFRAFQCLCDLVLPSSHDRQLVGHREWAVWFCPSASCCCLRKSTHGAMVAIKRVYTHVFMSLCLCV